MELLQENTLPGDRDEERNEKGAGICKNLNPRTLDHKASTLTGLQPMPIKIIFQSS